jgi:hypothetical protein
MEYVVFHRQNLRNHVYKTLNRVFLLSMNEVHIKYWFRDFQKKKFFIDFLDELKKPEKNRLCRLSWFHGCTNENFVRLIFERFFQVRDFSFWITEGIGLIGVSFHFSPQKQIPSGPIRIFGSSFTFTCDIDQF